MRDKLKHNEANRRYRNKHPERRRESYRRWYYLSGGKRKTRDAVLKKLYGLTFDQYEVKAEAQEHCCAICGKAAETERHGRLSVDHDHKTGMVRDLLCNYCNLMLGRVDDCPDLLEKGIIYLQKWRYG